MAPKQNSRQTPSTKSPVRKPLDSPAAKVKEILQFFANTISAVKLFPSEHATVKKFTEELSQKLDHFLEEHWKLELGVEEHCFTYEGEVVYEDTHPVKSFPFFFFKDGMQKLFFYKDLDKEEVKDFLEIIRNVSLLPPEEGDIVNALWERDFANIRYIAPDDFLETKIGIGREPLEIKVDKDYLYSGRIELTPEDREGLYESPIAPDPSIRKSESEEEHDVAPESLPLGEEETAGIESLVYSNRTISQEEEFLNLIVEISYLEDRIDQFPVLLEVVTQHHQEILKKGDFGRAVLLISHIRDLKNVFSKKNPKKAEIFEMFLDNISSDKSLQETKQIFAEGIAPDLDSFFAYMRLLPPRASSLISDQFESSSDLRFRQRAVEYLEEVGQKDLSALMNIVQDSKPNLTKEIIAIVRRNRDKKAVHFLASFLSYKNPSLRMAAVNALGSSLEESAGKILVGFLSDEDENVRIRAAANLNLFKDTTLTGHILEIVSSKNFKKKSTEEKKILIECLAKSQTEEAFAHLRSLLNRSSLFPRKKQEELRLHAAGALEMVATPQAVEALREGARSRNKKIKQACLQALEKLAPGSGDRSAKR